VVEQAQFEGMPEPGVLRLMVSGGQCVVTFGRTVMYRYDEADTGMRNLAIVAITDAGRRVDEVAAVFGLTATYVSILRGRAAREGSAGLVRRRGRPPRLGARQRAQAVRWAGQDHSQEWIGKRFGVARSVIGRVLEEAGPSPAQPELADTQGDPGVDESEATRRPEPDAADEADADEDDGAEAGGLVAGASARVETAAVTCRYAGAMLLHAYLDRVGAGRIFATLTGGPARRFDDTAVLSTATLGFAVGAGSVEGIKHLRRAEAGAAVGLAAVPELRTLRTRLAALADGADPLALQRAFATGMLTADPPASPVYYVDDHFVAYAGSAPVAKGYNTRRRLAEPGRADTVVCDGRGRPVLFAAGEPCGLTRTMPAVLDQLRQVTGAGAPILLGFDRGGAYPSVFTACQQAGMDWVTYRRGKLAPTAAHVRRSWSVRDGIRVYVNLAEEMITIPGYGTARQLTLVQDDTPVLQVLTSDVNASGAAMLAWLRARWRIENLFKYAAEHHGINTLADYTMDISPNTAKVPNPARAAARAQVAATEAALAAAERALPQLLAGPGTPAQKNAELGQVHHNIEGATEQLESAKATLGPIPAKLAANQLDPDAKRARPRIGRRGLQMVLRLLAFNSEAWLAEHLNAYLADPDEYRAITRHLLHLGGQVTYTRHKISVVLDRPDSPRIASALEQLTAELNTTPAHLPGDRRPITYSLTPDPISTAGLPLLPEV